MVAGNGTVEALLVAPLRGKYMDEWGKGASAVSMGAANSGVHSDTTAAFHSSIVVRWGWGNRQAGSMGTMNPAG